MTRRGPASFRPAVGACGAAFRPAQARAGVGAGRRRWAPRRVRPTHPRRAQCRPYGLARRRREGLVMHTRSAIRGRIHLEGRPFGASRPSAEIHPHLDQIVAGHIELHRVALDRQVHHRLAAGVEEAGRFRVADAAPLGLTADAARPPASRAVTASAPSGAGRRLVSRGSARPGGTASRPPRRAAAPCSVSTTGTGVTTPSAVCIGCSRSRPIGQLERRRFLSFNHQNHVEHPAAVPLVERQAAGEEDGVLRARRAAPGNRASPAGCGWWCRPCRRTPRCRTAVSSRQAKRAP